MAFRISPSDEGILFRRTAFPYLTDEEKVIEIFDKICVEADLKEMAFVRK